MEFRIEYAKGVHDDIQAIYDYISADSLQNALAVQVKIHDEITTLQLMPHRCSLAPENAKVKAEIRHMFVGNYRILFTTRSGSVVVLAVRHEKRLPLAMDKLGERSKG